MPHSTNYRNTLILPSPDCKASEALEPRSATTIAGRQFAILCAAPYGFTSDDVIFTVHADRSGLDDAARPAERAAFFSRGQPCLRCSPLVKTHGWAIHHDAEGRVALVDPSGPRMAALLQEQDDPVQIVEGMCQSRR